MSTGMGFTERIDSSSRRQLEDNKLTSRPDEEERSPRIRIPEEDSYSQIAEPSSPDEEEEKQEDPQAERALRSTAARYSSEEILLHNQLRNTPFQQSTSSRHSGFVPPPRPAEPREQLQDKSITNMISSYDPQLYPSLTLPLPGETLYDRDRACSACPASTNIAMVIPPSSSTWPSYSIMVPSATTTTLSNGGVLTEAAPITLPSMWLHQSPLGLQHHEMARRLHLCSTNPFALSSCLPFSTTSRMPTPFVARGPLPLAAGTFLPLSPFYDPRHCDGQQRRQLLDQQLLDNHQLAIDPFITTDLPRKKLEKTSSGSVDEGLNGHRSNTGNYMGDERRNGEGATPGKGDMPTKKRLRTSRTDSRYLGKEPLPLSFTPQSFSVILGKGSAPKRSPGNGNLRNAVQKHVERYKTATKNKRTLIAFEVLQEIHEGCPDGGAFVRLAPDGRWYEADDKEARDKVSAVFRDFLSDAYKSSSKSKVAKRRALLQEQQQKQSDLRQMPRDEKGEADYAE